MESDCVFVHAEKVTTFSMVEWAWRTSMSGYSAFPVSSINTKVQEVGGYIFLQLFLGIESENLFASLRFHSSVTEEPSRGSLASSLWVASSRIGKTFAPMFRHWRDGLVSERSAPPEWQLLLTQYLRHCEQDHRSTIWQVLWKRVGPSSSTYPHSLWYPNQLYCKYHRTE